VAIAGAAVTWLRDNLGLIEHARDVEALAGSVDDTAGVYFVPAVYPSHSHSCSHSTPPSFPLPCDSVSCVSSLKAKLCSQTRPQY
jgi:hypothetical protein